MSRLFIVVLAICLLHGPALAQERDVEERLRELERQVEVLRQRLTEQDTATVAELRAMIEAITREIEELRLGGEVVARADTGRYGFGPAASKVYQVGQGVSIGGYGEVVYDNFSDEREDGEPSGRTDQFDALRGIIYVGYKFDDRFLFNSEIEIEHGSTDLEGSVSLEFAYLDWLVSEPLGVRAGLLLAPVGFINELHEPPIFLGVDRPETETRIIPTTWRENGIGVFGEVSGISYRAYLMNGLDGAGAGGASGFSAEGLRGGRQKGSEAVAEDLALVGRVDYVGILGATIGTSLYYGGSGQGASPEGTDATIDAGTLIWEGHAEYRARGLELRGLVSLASVDDVEELNAFRELSDTGSIGERLVGWYLQAGYDVLRSARTQHRLIPYVRYERINTQDEVPDGFAADPANDRRIIVLGAAWKPITNVVVKADYQIHSNEADTGVDQFSAAIGYLF